MKVVDEIRYSERVEDTELLGPGKRAVLWVHGCCFNCPGCIAKEFRQGEYKVASYGELAQWYIDSGAEGLTISGGEPMLQAEGLSNMIAEIRKKKDTGVIVYTGYEYEQLLEKAKTEPGVQRFLNEIDLLIDGPYRREEDHNEPYRGSANQRILPLTDRYQEQINAYYRESKGRKIDVRLSKEKTLLIGVPSKEQAAIWANIKKLGKKTEGGEDDGKDLCV